MLSPKIVVNARKARAFVHLAATTWLAMTTIHGQTRFHSLLAHMNSLSDCSARLLFTRTFRKGFALGLILGWLSVGSALAFTIGGTVTDSQKTPVDGVVITATVPGASSPTASTVTTGSGGFGLSIPAGTYDLKIMPAAGSGLAITTLPALSITENKTLEVFLGLATLTWNGSVRIGPTRSGPPVPNQRIDVRQIDGPAVGSVVTAADGSFAIDVPPGVYDVTVSPAGSSGNALLPSDYSISIPGLRLRDEPKVLSQYETMLLGELVNLDVTVQDPQGNPVAGATISAQGDFFFSFFSFIPPEFRSPDGAGTQYGFATTDSAGQARIEMFGGFGGPIELTVTPSVGSGAHPVKVDVSLSRDTAMVVELPSALTWNGSVRIGPTRSGPPVPNQRIDVRQIDGPAVGSVVTAADGSFAIDVPPGVYDVTVSPAGSSGNALLPSDYSISIPGLRLRDEPKVLSQYETMLLGELVNLDVTVQDPQGNPVAGATISAQGDFFFSFFSFTPPEFRSPDGAGTQYGFATTDSTGQARIEMFGGPIELAVTPSVGSGAHPVKVDVSLSRDTAMIVELPSALTWNGSVRIGPTRSGPPVPNQRIDVRQIDGPAVGSVVTAADGSFAIDVPPGVYDVTVSPAGSSGNALLPSDYSISIPGLRLRDEPKVLSQYETMLLGELVNLDVTVQDPRGNPVAGATISAQGDFIFSFFSLIPPEFRSPDGAGTQDGFATTDSAGQARIEMFGGTIDVTVTPPALGGYRPQTFPVRLVRGLFPEVFVVLQPPNSPPVANAGPNQVVETTSPAGASVVLDGSASSDPDDPTLIYLWKDGATTIGSGATPTVTLSFGTHTITLTVIDALNALDTDTVVVTVVDTTPPTMDCPFDIVQDCAPGSGAVVNFTATATDIHDGPLAPQCNPPSGHTFTTGTTTVDCSAMDARGNENTCTFTVTVTANSSPSITTPPVSLSVPQGATATLNVTATGTAPLTYQWFLDGNPISGAVGPSYTKPLLSLTDNGSTYTVKIFNLCGEVTSQTALLSVTPDVTPPTLLSATADCANNIVTVTFSEPLSVDLLTTGSSALDAFNYQISGGVNVLNVTTSADGRTIILVVDALAAAVRYTLAVDNLSDPFANYIVPGSQITFMCPPPCLLVAQNSMWKYLDDGSDQGTFWLNPGFDDSGWLSGMPLFGFDTTPGTYPWPFLTPMPVVGGRITYYLRTRFTWDGSTAGAALTAAGYFDDGVVLYLNGVEAGRLRIPAGPVAFDSLASAASVEGILETLTLSTASLVVGDNVLAAEVHQNALASSDITFGLTLEGNCGGSPPAITRQPQDLTVTHGQTATFSFVATGSPSPTCRWFRDGLPRVLSCQDGLVTIPNVQVADAGLYVLVLSNVWGTAASQPVRLAVVPAATAPARIFINEWLANNVNGIVDPADGQHDDWFEIYNAGTNPVDLSGLFFTPEPWSSNAFQPAFPDYYLLPAGGFLRVWADGQPQQNSTNSSDLHVNFTLPVGGGNIRLYAADGTVIDAITFGPQIPDLSEGRFPDGETNRYLLAETTPGAANAPPSTTPPILSCPSDMVVACTDPVGASVDYAVTAAGVCHTNVSVTCVPASGSLFPPGITTVQCVAVDGCASTSSCAFTVTVACGCLEIVNETLQPTPGGFIDNFTLVNRSGTVPIRYVVLIPRAGCLAISPQVVTLNPPLTFGQSTNLSLNLQAAPGCADLCYHISIHDSNIVECCSMERCVAAPRIVTPPVAQTVMAGALATFSVVATGTPPLSYQWQIDGTDVPGATDAEYTRIAACADDGKAVTVRISSPAGSVSSLPALLGVVCPPSIVSQPQSRSVLVGDSVNIGVVATGGAPLSYQWIFCPQPNCTFATNLPGATGPSLELSNVQLVADGSYLAVVRNAAGSVTSAVARLTVATPCVSINNERVLALSGNAYLYSFDATNLSSVPIKHVALVPDSSCFSFQPPLLTLPVALAMGQGTRLSVTVTAGANCPTDLCFLIALHNSNLVECCSVEHCVALPPAPLVVDPGVVFTNGVFCVSFQSQAGLEYVVEYTDSLADPLWTVLNVVLGDGALQTIKDVTAVGPGRFYRLVVQSAGPPPSLESLLPMPPNPAFVEPNDDNDSGRRAAEKKRKGDKVWIEPHSGEVSVETVDLVISGRGEDFVWARKYASRTGPDTMLGMGWDFSYNVRIQLEAGKVKLSNGGGRIDTYAADSRGVYTSGAFAREGRFGPTGEFTVEFPGKGKWTFHRLDGSATQGKLKEIENRKGDKITLGYDGAGRLTNVNDALSRPIAIAYNTDGMIESVTDFAGRSVRYTYYGPGEPGGNLGDLKAVRSPLVTGTPNGNDFPAGKTTTYTYTKGFADERLNHNLLTITDGKGQTWLSNTYASASHPKDFYFDRVVQQQKGGPGETISFFYVRQPLGPGNKSAAIKHIENDRTGRVCEKLFDAQNRLIAKREYTGFAVPGQVTTEVRNRPVGQLRPSDPAFFETLYEWNSSSLLTRTVLPKSNEVVNVYAVDMDPNAPARAKKNLTMQKWLPGPLGGDQPIIQTSYEYHPVFNLVTQEIDGRGNVTQSSYDTNGNLTNIQHPLPGVVEDFEYNPFGQVTAHTLPDNGSGHRRRDAFTYYTDGPQKSYMEKRITDAGGLALTMTYEYDRVGNVVRTLSPKGKEKRFAVNALNQVVRVTSSEVIDGTNIRYKEDIVRDANDNVARKEKENRDAAGAIQPNDSLTTSWTYDVLDFPTSVTREVDDSNSVTVAIAYDANRLPALLRKGQATGGGDSNNVVQFSFDERNQLFKEIRAPGSPKQSTTQCDYDLNAKLKLKLMGLEAVARVRQFSYDGYDRLVAETDPMGNVTTYHYDASHNLVSERTDGELADAPGSAGNVRLAEVTNLYDSLDRLTRTDVAFFDTATQAPSDDGLSTVEYFYSANSQLILERDDNGHTTTTAYDTANRPGVVTDARGNTATYAYDAHGNVISVTEIDKSDLGSLDETFLTHYAYDNLDRLTQTTDNDGKTTAYAYDSRGNLVLQTDALNRATRYDYDGLDRLVRTVVDMNSNGPNPAEAADIVTTQTWDNSSRRTSQGDDNGHTTTYACDSLDRRIATTYADGTTETAAFDAHDNVVSSTDANGSVTTSAYDLSDRVTAVGVTRAPGVLGTTAEQYQYDGLSRLVAAQDDDSLVMRAYNSLSLVTHERQQALPGGPVSVVQSAYDGVGNQTGLAYPGGRLIAQDYEPLDRLALLRDDPLGANSTIAAYQYFGPRVQRREHGNGTRLSLAHDNLRRALRTTHSVIVGGALLDDRQYSWDAVDNKTAANNLLAGENRLYTYDAANRMARSQVVPGGPTIDYTLDGAGNRQSVAGGTRAGVYQMNAASPVPADFQVNQYTLTPFDNRAYDANGNLTGSGALELAYDYRNQLVKFTDLNTSQTFLYHYDPLGRRIAKTVAGAVTRFAYDEKREIEERDAAGATLATFVWGNGIDELLEMTRGGQRYFAHSDDLGSVMKMTDAAGNVSEQYRFGDYGEPFFFSGAGAGLAQSAIGNPHLFTGRRFDPETGLYHYRSRYLDPFSGRFVTRDTIGIWGDPSGLGNGYTYVGNNPASYSDPEGTAPKPIPGIDVIVKCHCNYQCRHRGSNYGGRGSSGTVDSLMDFYDDPRLGHTFGIQQQIQSENQKAQTQRHQVWAIQQQIQSENQKAQAHRSRAVVKADDEEAMNWGTDWPEAAVDKNGMPVAADTDLRFLPIKGKTIQQKGKALEARTKAGDPTFGYVNRTKTSDKQQKAFLDFAKGLSAKAPPSGAGEKRTKTKASGVRHQIRQETDNKRSR